MTDMTDAKKATNALLDACYDADKSYTFAAGALGGMLANVINDFEKVKPGVAKVYVDQLEKITAMTGRRKK